MALGTAGLFMPAGQRVIGQVMVEALLAELDNIKINAFMFRVAGFAGHPFDIRGFAMKTAFGVHIFCNVFVTIQTTGRLQFLAEFDMTGLAVFLIFPVFFRQGAR